jgi:hypothetical protein
MDLSNDGFGAHGSRVRGQHLGSAMNDAERALSERLAALERQAQELSASVADLSCMGGGGASVQRLDVQDRSALGEALDRQKGGLDRLTAVLSTDARDLAIMQNI